MTHRPAAPHTCVRWAAAAVMALGLVACSDSDRGADGTADAGTPSATSPTVAPATPTTSAEDTLHLVALGDSISTDNGCAGCTTFDDLYAQLAQQATGKVVVAQDLSVQETGVADLLEQVSTDRGTRDALAGADLVSLTIGHNDTPWNRVDDPCQAAPGYPVIAWRKITAACTKRATREFKSTLDQVLAEVAKVRGSTPVVLRVTTVYNSVIGDAVDPSWDSPEAVAPSRRANKLFADAQCRVVAEHGGACAEMIPLMNGPDGTDDAGAHLAADHTHMSQAGHQLTADALAALGFRSMPDTSGV